MMKRSSYLLALALALHSGHQQSNPVPPLDTLREIRIERLTKLKLGGMMPQSAEFCDWSGQTCSLKPRTFGGARAIALIRTEEGLISQFNFDYGVMSEEQVRAQIDEYRNRLGKPSSDSKSRTNQSDVRVLTWFDSSTTFELSYKSSGNGTEASARLLDNALNGRTH